MTWRPARPCSHGLDPPHAHRSAAASDTCDQISESVMSMTAMCFPIELHYCAPALQGKCADGRLPSVQEVQPFCPAASRHRIAQASSMPACSVVCKRETYLSGGGRPSLMYISGGEMNAIALMTRLPPSASTCTSVGLHQSISTQSGTKH